MPRHKETMKQSFHLSIIVKDEHGRMVELQQRAKLKTELDEISCKFINTLGAILRQYTKKKEILRAKKQKFQFAKFWVG